MSGAVGNSGKEGMAPASACRTWEQLQLSLLGLRLGADTKSWSESNESNARALASRRGKR